jgi:hypothetical protein
MGDPIITLRKQTPEEIDPEGPWNHAQGSFFVTINDVSRSFIRHTDVYERLSAAPVVKYAHLVAADIMMTYDHDYAVAELNFCPALTIESNLQKVASHALSSLRSRL